jgi:hypothetical protein
LVWEGYAAFRRITLHSKSEFWLKIGRMARNVQYGGFNLFPAFGREIQRGVDGIFL